MNKINNFTPHLNTRKNNLLKFKREINPLKKTKDVLNQRDKFTERELKEFSILYLLINNLNIFRNKIEAISEISFSNQLNSEFKKIIINYLTEEKFFSKKTLQSEDFDIKFSDLINQIQKNAPIQFILRDKDDYEILSIFEEIIEELDKIKLKDKIESLEQKVSLNLDEKLYSELISLRNQLKSR